MSLCLKKQDLIRYYREIQEKFPDKGIKIPQMVLDADDRDVFCWGFTIDEEGRAGSAPLHKWGYVGEDEKYHPISHKPGDLELKPEITILPREE